MTEAERCNEILIREAPAAGRCLSRLGLRCAFPQGIPWQTAAARATEINATIGQVTDGHGEGLPLPAMASGAVGLDPKITFLYSSQEGHPALRQAWAVRQRSHAGGSTAIVSTPMVVHGLTQAVSLVADCFADEDTDVVVPSPNWENYRLLFTLRPGANLIEYPFFANGKFNLAGMVEAIGKICRPKAIVVVNFPANPTGYMPTVDEGHAITEALLRIPGPAVVLFDDAYTGMVYEDGLMARSPFWDLAERCDPERIFPIKADGATKELFFFGGRMAFLTFAATGAAEAALLSKLKCIARSTVGVSAGPSQALVLKALLDSGTQPAIDERLDILRQRYQILKRELATLDGVKLRALPFNSGVFALVDVHPSIDANALRERLIREQSVGVISMPGSNALRIAYCSVAPEAIPELVRRLKAAVA